MLPRRPAYPLPSLVAQRWPWRSAEYRHCAGAWAIHHLLAASDDLYYPAHLARLVKLLDACPEVYLAYGGLRWNYETYGPILQGEAAVGWELAALQHSPPSTRDTVVPSGNILALGRTSASDRAGGDLRPAQLASDRAHRRAPRRGARHSNRLPLQRGAVFLPEPFALAYAAACAAPKRRPDFHQSRESRLVSAGDRQSARSRFHHDPRRRSP